MITGIIIGVFLWQLVSFITYLVFDNESENWVSGGVYSIIALIIVKIFRYVRWKLINKK